MQVWAEIRVIEWAVEGRNRGCLVNWRVLLPQRSRRPLVEERDRRTTISSSLESSAGGYWARGSYGRVGEIAFSFWKVQGGRDVTQSLQQIKDHELTGIVPSARTRPNKLQSTLHNEDIQDYEILKECTSLHLRSCEKSLLLRRETMKQRRLSQGTHNNGW